MQARRVVAAAALGLANLETLTANLKLFAAMNIKQVLVTLLTTAIAFSICIAGQTVEIITTTTGKTFQHCRIFKVDPDGVMFFHQHGGAKILFTDMTADSRNELGYDPEKAASYEKEIAAKQSKQREINAAYQGDPLTHAMYPMLDAPQMEPQYVPGYSPWNDGALLTPWFNNGCDARSYNPWGAIRHHSGERGLNGESRVNSVYSHYGTRGYSGVYSNNYGSFGGAYGPYLNRSQGIPLGFVPPLRSLAPAIGSRPIARAGGFSSGHR